MKEVDPKRCILCSAGIIFGLSVDLYKNSDALTRLIPMLAGVVTSAAFIGAYFADADGSMHTPGCIRHRELILEQSIVTGLIVGIITDLSFQHPFFTFLMTFCTSSAICYYRFNSLDANNTKSENNKTTPSAKVGDTTSAKVGDITSAKVGDITSTKVGDTTSAKIGDTTNEEEEIITHLDYAEQQSLETNELLQKI